MDNYNKLLSIENKSAYPFNLLDNLNDNIINTKKEIELEYIKDYAIYKEKNNLKEGAKKIKSYIYIYE